MQIEEKPKWAEEWEKLVKFNLDDVCCPRVQEELGKRMYMVGLIFFEQQLKKEKEVLVEEGIKERVEKLFPKWVKNHCNVKSQNYWYAQNAVGTLVGWKSWFCKLANKIEGEKDDKSS